MPRTFATASAAEPPAGSISVTKETALAVNQIFAGIAVADYDAALDWYERFMGRPPDLVPHAKEAAWQVTETGWVYISSGDASGQGAGLLTLMVDDLEDRVAGIAGRGIETGEIEWVVPGEVRSVWTTDPEGNRIQLGQVLANES
jgi:predicted enzyme related to lactoylglutathione lyase